LIYGCPDTKQQLSQWKSPQSPRAKKGVAGPKFYKEHSHCFFDMKEFAHREFVPPNTTVSSDFYSDVLRRLRKNVRRKRLKLWRNHNWLLDDNAPAQTPLKTTEFVTGEIDFNHILLCVRAWFLL
jgi:hypothetical protein